MLHFGGGFTKRTFSVFAVLGLALLLSACGMTVTPVVIDYPTGVVATASSVGGQFSGWTGGTDKFLIVEDPDYNFPYNAVFPTAIDGGGAFTMTLGTPPASYISTYSSCGQVVNLAFFLGGDITTSSTTMTDPNWVGYGFLATENAYFPPKVDYATVLWIYSDAARDVNCTETVSNTDYYYDLKLQQGWNIVINTVHRVDAGVITVESLVTGPIPGNVSWYYSFF